VSLTALALGVVLAAPPARPKLSTIEPQVRAVAERFRGRLGYHIQDLTTGEVIAHRSTERFPSASTIKTVLMFEAARQIDKGELTWDTTVPLPPVAERNSSQWAYYLREGLSINVDALTNLMMNVSDNTATVVLGEKLGLLRINQTLQEMGYQDTAYTVRVPETETRLWRLRRQFANMGVTSPQEMARFLLMIDRGGVLSEAAHDRMRRILAKQYWDDWVMGTVPSDVVVLSKVGALNRHRSEIAIVKGPRPYLVAIYTDNQADQRWVAENEGDLAIIRIGTLLWNHMHPERPYQAPPNAKVFGPTGGGVTGG
jgi:beta-lactamase class A